MATVKRVKVIKQDAPDMGFWLAQVLWFVLVALIAIVAMAFWWNWGMRWINYGGDIILPIVTLVIILAELWSIVYFKITVPDDEGDTAR